MSNASGKTLRDVVRERRYEAIRAAADAMMDGEKYDLIAELLSAYGYSVDAKCLRNYASRARNKLH